MPSGFTLELCKQALNFTDTGGAGQILGNPGRIDVRGWILSKDAFLLKEMTKGLYRRELPCNRGGRVFALAQKEDKPHNDILRQV